MAHSELMRRLGVQHPVIVAPMAGGPSTPELVAAVANAGGLGFLAGAYLTPEQIHESIRQTCALTSRPFGVNLFAGGYDAGADGDTAAMLEILSEVHERLGLPRPTVPRLPPDPFRDQLQVVLDDRPAVLSFTFGIPPADALAQVRSRGIAMLGTATTAEEARMLADTRVDGIVAQGAEAGAHRGTFAGPFEAAMIPTLELVVAASRSARLPVIAAGGLMDGRDVAAAMKAGASAAQLGTAFLACPESGAADAYKRAVLTVGRDTTVITRAFSGRPARGLRNAFIERVEGHEKAILPYPLQNALTRAMRAGAARRGEAGFLSLWAGQGVARARSLPASALVERIVEELED